MGNKKNKQVAFLHISDLHLQPTHNSRHEEKIGSLYTDTFRDKFCTTLDKELKEKQLILRKVIVSGDIADKGKECEYKKANEFLTYIKDKFNLEGKDFLLLPGNHDINQVDLISDFDKNQEKYKANNICAYQCHNVKFKRFKIFYEKFTGLEFDPNSPIVCCSPLTELKIIFIGLNSNYKEGFEADEHVGFIDTKKLSEALKSSLKEYKGYTPIAVFHHPPLECADKAEKPIENWSDVSTILGANGVSIFLYGHVHKEEAKEVTTVEIIQYSGVGSFAKDDSKIDNSFILFEEISNNNGEIIFNRNCYDYMARKPKPFWQFLSEDNQRKQIKVVNKQKITSIPRTKKTTHNIPFSSGINSLSLISTNAENDNSGSGYTIIEEINDDLLKLVAQKSLYKSGHYHWGPKSRTLGWINTRRLLSCSDTMQVCKNFVSRIISKALNMGGGVKNITPLILGVGFEGNILGACAAIEHNCFYSYVPSPFHSDHNEHEKKLFPNKKISFEKIIIVADVLFSGNSIVEIIKNYVDIFENTKEINIVSLFYTGKNCEQKLTNSFKGKIRKINIKYYFGCDKIPIRACIYENKEQCIINKEDLDDINRLYTENYSDSKEI